jgi:hypothetical protein
MHQDLAQLITVNDWSVQERFGDYLIAMAHNNNAIV